MRKAPGNLPASQPLTQHLTSLGMAEQMRSKTPKTQHGAGQAAAALGTVAELVPPPERVKAADLAEMRGEAAHCKACPLWGPATQTVFGRGPEGATLMLVGEQPGDQEDLAGEPFVGPAGELLDRALAASGIDRRQVYVTNAVKHFKFVPRGKRRLHQKPNLSEVRACRFWLEGEFRLVRPRVVVALGATAAQSVLNRSVRLMRERGQPIPGGNDETILLTVHPSYLLRLPDKRARDEQYAAFVGDLRQAASLAAK
jgi:uracil-DNA glycosylase family protein